MKALLDRPRTRLASLPTPLVMAPRLASALDTREILVKLDAETGFALGGNKVRKLEYELAPARLDGVDCLITAGGPQSNHCRVTAAFAARFGLRCILVVQGPLPTTPTGNHRLHHLFGAEIRDVASREERYAGMAAAAAEVEAAGGRPRVVPLGASTGHGALGYARAAHELLAQLDAFAGNPVERTLLFVPSSSAGTLAGLLLGLGLSGRTDVYPIGVSADADADELRAEAVRIAREGADVLGLDAPPELPAFQIDDARVGAGYGIPTPESEEATVLFARREGLVLDPTYTAKAAAGMIDWIRERGIAPGERCVFLHTGGHPGLLA